MHLNLGEFFFFAYTICQLCKAIGFYIITVVLTLKFLNLLHESGWRRALYLSLVQRIHGVVSSQKSLVP